MRYSLQVQEAKKNLRYLENVGKWFLLTRYSSGGGTEGFSEERMAGFRIRIIDRERVTDDAHSERSSSVTSVEATKLIHQHIRDNRRISTD
jgi:hypothetical protein